MSFKHVTHILWDWNGTLIDDVQLTYDVVRELIQKYNQREISLDEYRQKFCIPVSDLYRAVGFNVQTSELTEMAEYFHRRYEGSRDRFTLHTRVSEVLHAVTKSGRVQSILSAHPQDQIEGALSHFGIRHHFQSVIGATSNLGISKIAHGKEWFESSGLKPHQAVLIGDTDHDADVARALGIACVLVSQGHQEFAVLERTGARVFHTLMELEQLLYEQ